jgi:hypothetical protein
MRKEGGREGRENWEGRKGEGEYKKGRREEGGGWKEGDLPGSKQCKSFLY